MALFLRAGACAACALLSVGVVVGCRSNPSAANRGAVAQAPAAPPTTVARPSASSAVAASAPNARMPVQLASHRLQNSEPEQGPLPNVGQTELSLPSFIAEVQGRNASLEALVNAWRASAQRYPQVISLDDPMFMAMAAPASFASNQVDPAYILSGTQKIPWHGKRDAKGRAAQAEASAAFQEVQDARLQLAQAARMAFYDYYLVTRELALNRQNLEVMREFRDTARTKYENNQTTQQDVLQADIELADIERRQIELNRAHRVAIARINTLLRRTPDDPLPAAPGRLPLIAAPASIGSMRQMAAGQRPDLAAIGARVRAEEAAVTLARKQYYPDTEFFGRYDSFWQPASTQSDLRPQVGVNMNVPIYKGRLNAAVCEAEFRLSQRRAEYQQRLVDIQFEVQSAYEQVEESRRVVQLYREKFLPAAEQNVNVARSNYDVGKINFLGLIQAQQQWITLAEKQQAALTDYHRRLADLERAVGGPLPTAIAAEEISRPASQ